MGEVHILAKKLPFFNHLSNQKSVIFVYIFTTSSWSFLYAYEWRTLSQLDLLHILPVNKLGSFLFDLNCRKEPHI
jgi:hypothetical protein